MRHFKANLAKGERLLDRMLEAGIALEHDCGGALACASCRVVVREGEQALSAASEDELDMLERADALEPGARLACQAFAEGGELVVEVSEREVPARTAGTSPVSVSARAAQFLAAQLARHPAAVAVRLAVEPSGCSGFAYRIDPTDSIRGNDTVFESDGVRIAVDALSLPYLQGATVDLVQEGLARRLRFDNPNARQSCGCGASFGT
jgi:iron-sulfur cluster assembly protein